MIHYPSPEHVQTSEVTTFGGTRTETVTCSCGATITRTL